MYFDNGTCSFLVSEQETNQRNRLKRGRLRLMPTPPKNLPRSFSSPQPNQGGNVPISALPSVYTAKLCTIESAPREILKRAYLTRGSAALAPLKSVLSCLSCRNKKDTRRRHPIRKHGWIKGIPQMCLMMTHLGGLVIRFLGPAWHWQPSGSRRCWHRQHSCPPYRIPWRQHPGCGRC